jgi:transketolase
MSGRNPIPNRQAVCETLMRLAADNPRIVALVSDSRGSAAMAPFAQAYPERFVEIGIAEQNLVGVAAGLAASGMQPFVTSPACFLSMRAIEQIKVDVAYSQTHVVLVGISGGVSYGALGMSHHSLQDIAVMRAIPGISVFLPADRFETERLIEALAAEPRPAYVRIGRNPVQDVHASREIPFVMGKAIRFRDGCDVTIVATGETVSPSLDAAERLAEEGLDCRVLGVHTLKPFDTDAIREAARDTGRIVTVEEHSVHGGLGSAVVECLSENPVPVRILGIPDEPAIPGSGPEVFAHYGLDATGIIKSVQAFVERAGGKETAE